METKERNGGTAVFMLDTTRSKVWIHQRQAAGSRSSHQSSLSGRTCVETGINPWQPFITHTQSLSTRWNGGLRSGSKNTGETIDR
jgi:hypothetical protein